MWVEKDFTAIADNDPAGQQFKFYFRCQWIGCEANCGVEIETLEDHIEYHFSTFVAQSGLNGHWMCRIRGCEIAVTSADELSRHLKMHTFHAQKQYNGIIAVNTRFPELHSCNFPSSSRLVYQGDALICEWDGCLQTFVDINEYVHHLTAHIDMLDVSHRNEEMLYCCLWGNDCDVVIRSKTTLKTHVQHHSGDKMCACPFCGAFFANNTKLLDHVTRRQEGDPAFFCYFCQKSFKTARLLKAHCQRHVRKYKCTLCSIILDSTFDLRRHMAAVHAKIQNYFCVQCSKGFFQKSDLNKHMTVHSQGSAFECSACQSKFKWEKQLRQHVKTHDRDYIESPYLCHLCGSKYRRGSALSKHFSANHKLNVPDGFSRFQYKKCSDGMFRLQTKRCLGRNLVVEQGLGGSTTDGAQFVGSNE
ncbi:histone H4 transcription factor [Ditylenchus destructor]|nr:histone H4 transcription factor [Ditylenchus destructor]